MDSAADYSAPRITGCLMKDGTFVSMKPTSESRQKVDKTVQDPDARHSLGSTDLSSQSSEEEDTGEEQANHHDQDTGEEQANHHDQDSGETSSAAMQNLDDCVKNTLGEIQQIDVPVDYSRKYSRSPDEPLQLERSWEKLEEAESLLQFSIDSIKTK
ncbi:uncharacterized protein LOC122265994 isoform X1 [Penaeus japonicus]|uniref:uncharacterized protein LOC122265994 isoform X1 n=1 Tax=Penaeus japonicus TaxID=27405 RepID=UPI001C70D556|nr:uncharacterized protein LOC122265994 isoform X1 [Penaeus japonicus]XP_042891476.1 uncharacterized protein LOC122265994 isoform X1 [Penaeus japonicus]